MRAPPEIDWALPDTMIVAAAQAIKIGIEYHVNDDFIIKFMSSVICGHLAILHYELELYKEGNKVDQDPLSVVININYKRQSYGSEADENVSNTEKLVMDLKIDDTFSPDGIKFLQQEVLAKIDNYADWVEDEIDFDACWYAPLNRADELRARGR